MPRMFTNRMCSASIASSGSSTGTNRMLTNRMFMSRMTTSRMMGQVAAVSSGYPDEDDVRNGVIYGASSEFEGSAVPFATPLADLDDANMSAFETSALAGIETIYDVQGVPADWINVDGTERIQILIESKQTIIDDSGNTRKEVEVVRCSVLCSIVPNPTVGDTVKILASNGTRIYKLTQNPVMSDSHLEWELEVQRTYLRKVGGVRTVPTN